MKSKVGHIPYPSSFPFYPSSSGRMNVDDIQTAAKYKSYEGDLYYEKATDNQII